VGRMLYVTHDPNSEDQGRITQANKFYGSDDELAAWEEVARDQLKQTFVKTNFAGLVPPEFWYVQNNELTRRPFLGSITVNKTVIKPDGEDYALIQGIPSDAKYRIYGANELLHSDVMDGTEMQVSIPVEMVYSIYFDKWPFQTFKLEIRAQL
jgi:hypothetical protein